jgi:hypothetical protein
LRNWSRTIRGFRSLTDEKEKLAQLEELLAPRITPAPIRKPSPASSRSGGYSYDEKKLDDILSDWKKL